MALSDMMRDLCGRVGRRRLSYCERLEQRCLLTAGAPFVIDMTAGTDGVVLVRMSEEVIGVDTGDFQLSQAGQSIDLTAAQLLAISPTEFELWLPQLVDGLFELRLAAEGSEIADLEGNLLEQDYEVSLAISQLTPTWQVEYTPTAWSPAPRRIAALGDSLTYEPSGSYVTALRSLLSSSSAEVTTFAEPGRKVDAIAQVWQTQVRDANFDTVIIFAGVNDLSTVGSTANNIFPKLQAIYDDAMARGLNVICISVTPWGQFKKWTPERQLETVRLNQLIQQYASDHPSLMHYVDAYSQLGAVEEPHRQSPRYDVGDGLHFSDVGYERLAHMVAAAVIDLDTPTSIPQSAIIEFDRPVFGLTAQHIQLTRHSTNDPLDSMPPEFLPIELIALDDTRYQINFATLSDAQSDLRLNLDLTQGAIVDRYGRAVGQQADVEWQLDYALPTASFTLTQPPIAWSPMESVRISFSEAVTMVSAANFALWRDRMAVPEPNLEITRFDDRSFDIRLADSHTATSGTYHLIYIPSSVVSDQAGNLSQRGALATWVQLDAQPQVIDGTLYVSGTAGPDNLEVVVRAGAIDVAINDLEMSWEATDVVRIELAPGDSRDLVSMQVLAGAEPIIVAAISIDGQDQVYLYDSSDQDLLVTSPTAAALTAPTFQLLATAFAKVEAISRAGSDIATLHDSPGVDRWEGRGQRNTLTGIGFEVSTIGFTQAVAISSSGGADLAELFDSPGNDRVEATMAEVTLRVGEFAVSAQGFSRTNVRATVGNDAASLVGSAANEKYIGQATNSVWSSGPYSRYFYGFDQIDLTSGGGNDQVTIYDSPGDDVLTADSRTATLTNSSVRITARDFVRTNVYSRSGTDLANFVGQEISEAFTGQATFGSLAAGGFSVFAYGFDKVTATSGGGNDTAKLFGSPGDDFFEAFGTSARMWGNSFDNHVLNYASVNAYSQAGRDSARMVGSAASETVTGRPTITRMVGSDFNNAANNFAQVIVESGGGPDIATLYDSAGDDQFIGDWQQATLSGPSYSITAINYVRVNAYASTGNDHAQLYGSSGNETFTGRVEFGALQGPSAMLFAGRFDSVVAHGGGGTDLANLYDSAGDDQATVEYRAASLTGINFNNRVTDFGRVQLYASSGHDTADLTDSPGNERFQGSGTSGTLSTTGFATAFQRFDTLALSDSQGGTNDVWIVGSLAYELLIGVGWRRRS